MPSRACVVEFPPISSAAIRLLIGPANSAGQGFGWAEAASRFLHDTAAINFRYSIDDDPMPAHLSTPVDLHRHDLEWVARFRRYAREAFTHLLFESNAPIFGTTPRAAAGDVARWRALGKTVAMVAHGSDVRVPSVHARREAWHQYQHMDAALVERLESKAIENLAVFRNFDGPTFVSTPGLLSFVEGATWLPVVVDPARWATVDEPFERPVPVVMHAPSSTQKGSAWIDPVLETLADEGLIFYRRVSGVARDQMPGLVASSDILVEQFGIADYSVAACEAMAAGRLVVSRVDSAVREHVEAVTGHVLPIVEANPHTLGSVIRSAVLDRSASRTTASRGRAFVDAVHSGQRAAEAMRTFLS